ncbi:hypothetical protein F4801DRAFT_571947 [Xylaria longipes]|nr:hypothetical protein F4801DRAFT_571947 [Xylaria longipes]
MLSSSKLIAAALAATSSTFASPATVFTANNTLKLRDITLITGCDITQEAKLLQDLSDVVDIADNAGSMDPSSTIFDHYFRIDDLDGAMRMWRALGLAEGTDYHFSFLCAPQNDQQCSQGGRPYAITDSIPEDNGQPRQIKICPLYWTDKGSKLSSNSKKYDSSRSGWCTVSPYTFSSIAIGAEVLMHEMSHLDEVGSAARFPLVTDSQGFASHGTEDPDSDSFPDARNEPEQARQLRDLFRNGKAEPDTLAPYRSAENIAASALEWWVKTKCGYPNDVDFQV